MVPILRIPGLVVLFVLFAGPASAQHTNTTPITITDCPNPCPASGQPASLYPSTIIVSGEVGVVQRVSVTVHGFSHAFPADADFLLVSPSGRKSVIMSDFGAGSPGVSNITVTLDDYAQRPVPSTVTGNTGIPFVSGSYRPANSGTTDLFPAPAPGGPYTYTLSAFNGDSPNGTWSLYVIDDANLDPGSISGGWTITFDVRPPAPAAGDILISEFRTRGAGTNPPVSDGSADEFIELYNNTDSSITIIDSVPGADPTSGSGAGWRIAGAQGAAEAAFLVLPQTQSTAGPLALAPRSYFLISTQPVTPNPAGNTYSLSTYPTGTGITASGSANISVNPGSATVGFLPDDVGLAIFSTSAAVSAARLDSVGFSSVTHADYKEGAGLAPATGIITPSQHSWTRRLTAGVPQDTGDNAADFLLVSTTGDVIDGQAATLGAPGPERGNTMTAFTTSGAPSHFPAGAMPSAPIDPTQPEDAAPNLVRDLTPVTNGTNGTIKIRRRYTNNTGDALVALRFRVAALSTRTGGAALAGQADLRVLNSPTQTITLTDTSTVTSQALTVQTPAAQALGGGVNSSLAVGVITTTAPLANGASVVVEFNLGVETEGPYRIVIRGEGLAADGIGGVNVLDVFEQGADLAITKTDGATTVTAGGSTTYTIVASNSGPASVTGATVADTFPASLTCTYTCVGAGGGTCTAGGSGNISDTVNLPVGGSVAYIASCAIAPGATGTLSNTANVSPPAGLTDPNPANNSATDTNTLAASADLAIGKVDTPDPVTAGQNLTYTITVTSSGPSHAASVSMSDTLPAGTTFVSLSAPAGWSCATPAVGAGGTISCGIASVSVGSATFALTVRVAPTTAPGTVLTNTATVTSATADPTAANNAATASTGVVTRDFGCDVNGDGNPEFLTGAGTSGGPHVRVWTVAGSVLSELAGFFAFDPGFAGGVFVACRDLTGDGVAEIITGAGPGGGPAVHVWSTVGGAPSELVGFMAYDPGHTGGVVVAAGDLTGDGVSDLITGAGPGGGPHVRVWSVASGSLSELMGFMAYEPDHAGGVAVAAGDLTGDGVGELITGAGPGGGPHVRVWSVAGGRALELAGFFAYEPAFGGGVEVAAGDLTGDGVAELITGAGPGGGPHVRVWSLIGGSPIEIAGFSAYDPAFIGGVSVAAKDLTGDGIAELITGAGPGGGPHVRVWSLTPAGFVEIAGFFAFDPAFQGGVRLGK